MDHLAASKMTLGTDGVLPYHKRLFSSTSGGKNESIDEFAYELLQMVRQCQRKRNASTMKKR